MKTPDKMDNFTAPPTPTHIPYNFWGVEHTMQLVIREAGIDTLIGQIIWENKGKKWYYTSEG